MQCCKGTQGEVNVGSLETHKIQVYDMISASIPNYLANNILTYEQRDMQFKVT